ncbi:HIT family protein [Cellulomonas sp. H30R-01]|uniref:HIT family protein n=1 Tax=Cellulomonas sp. H30R-01 TaxID=2704467 RepID=UPI00192ED12C|nr:HIT family protein [Cellulomonas sp. H30R-01]
MTTGHLLVIPKVHVPFLAGLDDELGQEVFRVGRRMAAALRASDVPCDGLNVFLADGEAAFQEVFHLHLHVFPRTPGDGFGLVADWRVRPRDELDGVAARVRAGLIG